MILSEKNVSLSEKKSKRRKGLLSKYEQAEMDQSKQRHQKAFVVKRASLLPGLPHYCR